MLGKKDNLSFNFGPVKSFVFLGGGALLLRLIQWAKLSSVNCAVITSPRHSQEIFEDKTFKELLNEGNFSYLITDKIFTDDVERFIQNFEEPAFFSFGAAWIFKKDVLSEFFDNKLINAHGTRLPENRGGGGFSWQIMSGNKQGYCQLHLVDEGLDTGNIIFTEEFLYPVHCRIPRDYDEYYQDKLYKIVTDIMGLLATKKMNFQINTQLEYHSTYWPRLNSDIHGWIDWSWSLSQIERFICAFDFPYTGAKTFYNGHQVALRNCRVEYCEGQFHPFQTGIVYRVAENWICIAKQNGTLIIENVFDEYGKDITKSLSVGDRFFTNNEVLEKAKKRVVYTASKLKS